MSNQELSGQQGSAINDIYDELTEIAKKHTIRYAGPFTSGLISRALGVYIYDEKEREILDFTSGQMCAIAGHSHPKIVEAIESACRTAIHLHSNQLSPQVIALCKQLADLLPAPLEKVMLLSTGSEANEAALRMAKLYTKGFEVYALSGSWHGMTAGSNASTYAFGRQGYGPAMPGVHALPMPSCYRCPVKHCRDKCDMTCLEAGFDLADRASVGAPAAFLFEPVISAGGIVELPPGYMTRLRELCDARGLLIITDEAQTGMGRIGDMFGFQQDQGFVPDFLTLSKTLGGGLPLSATITSTKIEQTCYDRGFIFATSHVSDPLPAHVGLAMISIVLKEKLAENARQTGKYFKQQLQLLQERYECIGDVRGRGLLLGVEIVSDREKRTPDPALGSKIMDRCYDLGLSMNIVRIPSVGSVFRIAPPLTITTEHVDRAIGIIDQAISESLDQTK